MNETIKELYPASDIELVLTTDGSGTCFACSSYLTGIGAAIIAATVVHK